MVSDKFRAWVKSYPGKVQGLADNMGVHRSTVYSWLAGTTEPGKEHIKWLRQVAGRKLKLGDIVSGF